MEAAYRRFSDDPDIAVLYADAVMNTQPWNYWDRGGKPRPGIAAIRSALENAIQKHPDHPGARHIYIHLMEASDEVDVAVPSAERLGSRVPAAGHLDHMPAHIYIRVGRYQDAAEANVRAIAADEDYITQCRAQGIYPAAYYPHNIHFLNAVLMMDGQSKRALDAARKVAAQHDHAQLEAPGFGFAHLLKALPLLTMVRFGMWQQILGQATPGPISLSVKRCCTLQGDSRSPLKES
jgi:tetratricopeptide (TPR) repeat protein